MPPVCRPRPPSCGEEGPPRKKIYRSFSQPFSGARGGTEHQSVQKSAPEAKRADPAAERGARERRAASYHRAGGRVLAARAAINRKERLKTMNENDLGKTQGRAAAAIWPLPQCRCSALNRSIRCPRRCAAARCSRRWTCRFVLRRCGMNTECTCVSKVERELAQLSFEWTTCACFWTRPL